MRCTRFATLFGPPFFVASSAIGQATTTHPGTAPGTASISGAGAGTGAGGFSNWWWIVPIVLVVAAVI